MGYFQMVDIVAQMPVAVKLALIPATASVAYIAGVSIAYGLVAVYVVTTGKKVMFV